MTGWFVTDDERGRILWRGNPEDCTLVLSDRDLGPPGTSPVFDVAAAVLAPDDALVERVAQRKHRNRYPDGSHDDCPVRGTDVAQLREWLAAIREEAGR